MREQADFLNDISNTTAQPRHLLGGRVVAINAHDASRGGEEAIDQAECRALSRTAAAEEDERLAGAHGKRYVVDERSALQLVPQAAHVEDRIHVCDATCSASNSGSGPRGPSYPSPSITKGGGP